MARRKQTLADAIRGALAKPTAESLSKAVEPWSDRELTLADAEGLVAVDLDREHGASHISSMAAARKTAPASSLP